VLMRTNRRRGTPGDFVQCIFSAAVADHGMSVHSADRAVDFCPRWIVPS
jgi:hypothetical protein